MTSLYQEDLGEHWMMRWIPIDTVREAFHLLQRFQEVEHYRYYVLDRLALVIPTVAIIFLVSIACALGIIALIADVHFLLVIPVIVLSTIILVGSLLVQLYVFFAWMEGRSLNLALGNRHRPVPGRFAIWLRQRLALDLSPVPPVPWIFVAIFLALPLTLLAFIWTSASLAIAAIGLVVPIIYARLD